MKKVISGNSSLFMSIIEIILGVLLLINPVVLFLLIGITLILQAVIDLITFFFSKKAKKA